MWGGVYIPPQLFLCAPYSPPATLHLPLLLLKRLSTHKWLLLQALPSNPRISN